jgi:hypothetical protein
MPDHRNFKISPFEERGYLSSDDGLSAACSDRANRNDGYPAFNHRFPGPEEDKILPLGKNQRGLIHKFLMGDVAIRKDDLVDKIF